MAINLMDAFENEPPAPDMVLPGLVKGTIGLLTSAGGVGKSFWVMEAAMGVASEKANKSLLNLAINKHGPVVILNAEDQSDTLKTRLHSMGKFLDADARCELINNLVIDDLYGEGCDIMDPKWSREVIDVIVRNKARLCALDTLSRWHRLNENDNGDMGRLMAQLEIIARESGAAILLIHHIAKGAALNGQQMEQQSARGASLLVNNARWQANMATMSESEAKSFGLPAELRKGYVKFGVSKQNYGLSLPEAWLQRAEGGVLKPAIPTAKSPLAFVSEQLIASTKNPTITGVLSGDDDDDF